MPVERELFSEPPHLLECIAGAVVTRERPFQQQSIVDLPKARVHLLVSESAGRHMQNLIELHNGKHARRFQSSTFVHCFGSNGSRTRMCSTSHGCACPSRTISAS